MIKKILILFIILLLLLISALSAGALFLFSPKGNEFIKNYAEKELNKKVGIPVEIKTFQMKSGRIALDIHLEDGSRIDFDGSYSISGLWIKGSYDADIRDLSVMKEFTGRKIRGPLKIRGNMKWEKGELRFDGIPDIFKSRSSFSGRLKDSVVEDLMIEIEKLNIKTAFESFGIPVYATGHIDASASISSFNLKSKEIKGNLDIYSKDIKTVDSLIKKSLELDYVEPVNAEFDIASNFQDTSALFTTRIRSSIALIQTHRTSYNLSTNVFESDFEIFMPDLKKLNFITERNLKGAFRTGGNMKIADGKLSFSAETTSLGGNIAIVYDKNRLNAEMKDVSAAKVSSFFGMNNIFGAGEFSLDADAGLYGENFDEIMENLYGNFHLRGNNIVLNLIDIDAVVENFSRTKEINLFDIGAIALAGPLGLAFSKAKDLSLTSYRAQARGSSIIKDMNAYWEINRAIAETKDVAISTKKHRIASRGRINLKNQRFMNFNIALVDENGCSTFMQQIEGQLANPRVSASKTFTETAKNLFDSILLRAPARQDKKTDTACEVFYEGVVQHPNY